MMFISNHIPLFINRQALNINKLYGSLPCREFVIILCLTEACISILCYHRSRRRYNSNPSCCSISAKRLDIILSDNRTGYSHITERCGIMTDSLKNPHYGNLLKRLLQVRIFRDDNLKFFGSRERRLSICDDCSGYL